MVNDISDDTPRAKRKPHYLPTRPPITTALHVYDAMTDEARRELADTIIERITPLLYVSNGYMVGGAEDWIAELQKPLPAIADTANPGCMALCWVLSGRRPVLSNIEKYQQWWRLILAYANGTAIADPPGPNDKRGFAVR